MLYIEGNSIEKIEGLEELKELRCLYMHENIIRRIEGLDSLIELRNLNLQDNMISRIDNLGNNGQIETLNLKRNKLKEVENLKGILECPKIGVLDISENYIEDESVIEEIFEKMESLGVLYF